MDKKERFREARENLKRIEKVITPFTKKKYAPVDTSTRGKWVAEKDSSMGKNIGREKGD